MPNRRASRNAYYFFVQEKIPELRRRGLPVARVADAIPYCSPDWAVRLEAREPGPGSWQVGGPGGRERGLERPWALLEGEEAPRPRSRADRRRNRLPAMSRRLLRGPGHQALTAASCFPFPSPQAPEGGGKGEICRNGPRVESCPGEGLRAFGEAGKVNQRAATCLTGRHAQ